MFMAEGYPAPPVGCINKAMVKMSAPAIRTYVHQRQLLESSLCSSVVIRPISLRALKRSFLNDIQNLATTSSSIV